MPRFRKILSLKNHVAHYYTIDGQRVGNGSYIIVRGNVYTEDNSSFYVDFVWPHTMMSDTHKICFGGYVLNTKTDVAMKYSFLDYFSIIRHNYINKLNDISVDEDRLSTDFTWCVMSNIFIDKTKNKIIGIHDRNEHLVEPTTTSSTQIKICKNCGYGSFRFRKRCIKCNHDRFKSNNIRY